MYGAEVYRRNERYLPTVDKKNERLSSLYRPPKNTCYQHQLYCIMKRIILNRKHLLNGLIVLLKSMISGPSSIHYYYLCKKDSMFQPSLKTIEKVIVYIY